MADFVYIGFTKSGTELREEPLGPVVSLVSVHSANALR